MTDPVVSTAWLGERVGDPAIQVVDATLPKVGQAGHGRDSYAAGHLPGAVFFDINGVCDPATDLPHMLPTPEAFAEMIGELGLRRDATIVVYDAHGIYSAPRVWWTLRTMGFPRVFVLDGGLPKWRAEGRPVETTPSAPAASQLDAAFDAGLVRDLDAVRQLLERREAQVVDARPAARFRGEAAEPRPGLRSGHMPGALNLPSDGVVRPDGTLKSADELRALFEDAQVDLARPIVTTCGSGVTASTLALALARLGREDVAVYDGSWSEWGARADVPVVTGA
ncbi:3-mercaptopyruvate sulfurtransferase [Phenylobacterium sp. J367]|uniref:3-mercaptopyruvate sulfurtransferase n=1 Tax=Phenylobacterium sp. J367 TaxID=2898435 RepID=UPI0021513C47|nr:3-mercaptopyruvate sulfurtransferase [Phenylobacterium sp. J367]MCR5880378.1 3-mercaptopyruvate sulfurtransferase [Phenylobacterium sp. J367]